MVGAGAIGLLALPATAATPTVTYDGSCGVLSATSRPDKSSLSTQKSAGEQTANVLVVNDLNAPATPYADGRPVTWSDGSKVVIDKGESQAIPFAAGPVELTLVPNCSVLGILDANLSKKYSATEISVLAAPAGNSNTGAPANPGSGSGDSNTSSGKAGSKPDTGSRPDSVRDPVARGAVPPAGSDAGKPSADKPSDDSGAVGAPADNGSNGSKHDAVGPMVRTNNSGGLGTTTLALIAAVCLLGVGAAALRTIVVARAARASY